MTSEKKAGADVDAAFLAIADGAPVAWRDVERSSTDSARLDALRLLEDIASAYRQDAGDAAPSGREVLFRWGALEVQAPLGAGSYGEVYRAFDPWLGRAVALKLFRSGAEAGLDEARRLARLRHRNVLSVFGCGIHDDRAGLWSELIDGRTCAAIVADDGEFSAEETLRIGRDIAQALAAVHAAGLVHGDVKAENVMRERGGRVVLMDFGAGGDARLLAGRRLMSGTPRYLPPEVLDGAPLSASSDIYALGVLLFLLLAARHPYADTEPAALREAQRRGAPSLQELRPELPRPLCELVASCLAAELAQRPRSAQALAAQLAHLMPGYSTAAPRGRALWLIGAAAGLLAGAVLAWAHFAAPAWRSTAKFLLVTRNGNVELAANSTLHEGDRVRLVLDTTRAVHVYVLNEDAANAVTVLFPLSGEPHNPLAAGAWQLPGGVESAQAWEVSAPSASEEFVVIASLQSLPELEAELAAWHRASGADTTRSVDTVVDAPQAPPRAERLRRIVQRLSGDQQHVRWWEFRFQRAG